MIKCTTCKKAVFDPLWGEYKCSVYQHTIYLPDKVEECPEYKQGEPKETKDHDEYKELHKEEH